MVSENSENRQYVSISADWGLPKFVLSTKVQTSTVSFAKKLKTGEIIGIEYISPDSLQVQQGSKPGWSYKPSAQFFLFPNLKNALILSANKEKHRNAPRIGVTSTYRDDFPSHVNGMKGAILWCQKIAKTAST